MEPIEYLKRERKHLRRLAALRRAVYTPVCPMQVGVHATREPVPPGQQAGLNYRSIRGGTVWGGLFSCAWFRARATVPEVARGRHVVAHIDVGGEGAVYDGSEPVHAITSIMSYIDRVQSGVGKTIIEISLCAEPGQDIELYIDAGYNGYFNDGYRKLYFRQKFCYCTKTDHRITYILVITTGNRDVDS